jgi:predicted nucleotidyltransferase
MEQKDYALEIVRILSSGENYVRNIAKKLNINPMMILRKINFLMEKNVLDFKLQGRNKIYFLKKNSESRAFFIMAEEYALVNFLKKNLFLRDFVDKIQNDSRINLVLIFGSYVKGNIKKQSDVDIFIETDNSSLKKEYSSLDSRFSIKIGNYDKSNELIQEINKNHIILKGAEIYYEKFFN